MSPAFDDGLRWRLQRNPVMPLTPVSGNIYGPPHASQNPPGAIQVDSDSDGNDFRSAIRKAPKKKAAEPLPDLQKRQESEEAGTKENRLGQRRFDFAEKQPLESVETEEEKTVIRQESSESAVDSNLGQAERQLPTSPRSPSVDAAREERQARLQNARRSAERLLGRRQDRSLMKQKNTNKHQDTLRSFSPKHPRARDKADDTASVTGSRGQTVNGSSQQGRRSISAGSAITPASENSLQRRPGSGDSGTDNGNASTQPGNFAPRSNWMADILTPRNPSHTSNRAQRAGSNCQNRDAGEPFKILQENPVNDKPLAVSKRGLSFPIAPDNATGNQETPCKLSAPGPSQRRNVVGERVSEPLFGHAGRPNDDQRLTPVKHSDSTKQVAGRNRRSSLFRPKVAATGTDKSSIASGQPGQSTLSSMEPATAQQHLVPSNLYAESSVSAVTDLNRTSSLTSSQNRNVGSEDKIQLTSARGGTEERASNALHGYQSKHLSRHTTGRTTQLLLDAFPQDRSGELNYDDPELPGSSTQSIYERENGVSLETGLQGSSLSVNPGEEAHEVQRQGPEPSDEALFKHFAAKQPTKRTTTLVNFIPPDDSTRSQSLSDRKRKRGLDIQRTTVSQTPIPGLRPRLPLPPSTPSFAAAVNTAPKVLKVTKSATRSTRVSESSAQKTVHGREPARNLIPVRRIFGCNPPPTRVYIVYRTDLPASGRRAPDPTAIGSYTTAAAANTRAETALERCATRRGAPEVIQRVTEKMELESGGQRLFRGELLFETGNVTVLEVVGTEVPLTKIPALILNGRQSGQTLMVDQEMARLYRPRFDVFSMKVFPSAKEEQLAASHVRKSVAILESGGNNARQEHPGAERLPNSEVRRQHEKDDGQMDDGEMVVEEEAAGDAVDDRGGIDASDDDAGREDEDDGEVNGGEISDKDQENDAGYTSSSSTDTICFPAHRPHGIDNVACQVDSHGGFTSAARANATALDTFLTLAKPTTARLEHHICYHKTISECKEQYGRRVSEDRGWLATLKFEPPIDGRNRWPYLLLRVWVVQSALEGPVDLGDVVMAEADQEGGGRDHDVDSDKPADVGENGESEASEEE